MNSQINILKFLLLYFGIRIFSYIFTPATPLWAQNPINTLASLFILAISLRWILKNDERGWYIILLEIILGGGGYLKIFGTSLRTYLFIGSLTIYFGKKLYTERKNFFKQLKNEQYLLFTLLLTAIIASALGLYHNHASSAVISDLIPYFFLLYYFPLSKLWSSENFQILSKNALLASVFGNTLLILFTQIGFSSNIFTLQDYYYHWYRDIALGKITEINFDFYRLVLNEHLLLIPITIYFIADIIKNKINKINTLALGNLLFILANNLTRIYMVALAVGTLALFSIKNWKRYLIVSAASALMFVIIFVTTHTLASRGQSLGLEIFGLRLQSIASPQIEDSSLSRLLLLPKILEKIKDKPLIGQGLGDTVTVYSPIFKTDITTPHFDWGYLEIYTEMGLYGLLAWIAFISYLFYLILKNKNDRNLSVAILLSILVINLTSPALFHVFGILLMIFLYNKKIINHTAL
jgi:O-antigen ligase